MVEELPTNTPDRHARFNDQQDRNANLIEEAIRSSMKDSPTQLVTDVVRAHLELQQRILKKQYDIRELPGEAEDEDTNVNSNNTYNVSIPPIDASPPAGSAGPLKRFPKLPKLGKKTTAALVTAGALLVTAGALYLGRPYAAPIINSIINEPPTEITRTAETTHPTIKYLPGLLRESDLK